jgi:hypothetical protein
MLTAHADDEPSRRSLEAVRTALSTTMAKSCGRD